MLPSLSTARLFLSNLPIHRKGLVVIVIPVLVLILSTGLFSYAQWNANVAEGWVKHTLEVEKQIYLIVGTIQQAQVGAHDQAAHDESACRKLSGNSVAAYPLEAFMMPLRCLVKCNGGLTEKYYARAPAVIAGALSIS